MYHEEIAQLTARIVEAERPEKIILFGSYASGTATESSDIDLLVISRSTLPRRERELRLILARPGSQPCRKPRNLSRLRGHSSTPSSQGYHLALQASTILPKTRRPTSGPVGQKGGNQIVIGTRPAQAGITRGSENGDQAEVSGHTSGR
jgi:hypothetical protein